MSYLLIERLFGEGCSQLHMAISCTDSTKHVAGLFNSGEPHFYLGGAQSPVYLMAGGGVVSVLFRKDKIDQVARLFVGFW